jgi:isopenicillin N synthase-like dioxygenase
MQNVRRIDLADQRSDVPERRARFARDLAEGLMDTGFVRVVGHRVDDGLLQRAESEFAAFFRLDDAARARCIANNGGQRGYTPFGIEHAKDHPTPDQKHFFHVGQPHPPERARDDTYPPNVWPLELPGLSETALGLYSALEDCAGTLLEAIAEAWALPQDRLSSMLTGGNSILRALHYPPPPPIASKDLVGETAPMRAAPHEDINLITLLCDTREPGLEILGRDGAWLPVASQPGEVIADAGDMLARISNGRIPAATHRVVADAASAERDRYAFPFFAHPRPECDLAVLDAFLSAGEAPRWPPIDAGQFLETRLREIGLIP